MQFFGFASTLTFPRKINRFALPFELIERKGSLPTSIFTEFKEMVAETTGVFQFLDNVTKEGHPYFHEVQVFLFASVTFTGTKILGSAYPERAITFIVVAYAVHRLLNPQVARLFGPVKHIPLGMDAARLCLWSSVVLSGKAVCLAVGENISFGDTAKITLVFLGIYFIARLVLRHLSGLESIKV